MTATAETNTDRPVPELGRYGVWHGGVPASPEIAATVERLGFDTLWVGGSPAADLDFVEPLLAATDSLVVATGIVNIWSADAAVVATATQRIEAAYPGRFLLGVGAGHPEATSDYSRPVEALERYLDTLDDGGVSVTGRVLAALGPRVLELSRRRSAGAHPYLTTPEHTAQARGVIGTDAVLAPEQGVVVGVDGDDARAVARAHVGFYLRLRNYVQNWRALGFDDDDFVDGGSDRLVDALVAFGPTAAATRLGAHLHAGASHVCVQVLGDPEQLLDGLAALAAEIGLRQ